MLLYIYFIAWMYEEGKLSYYSLLYNMDLEVLSNAAVKSINVTYKS